MSLRFFNIVREFIHFPIVNINVIHCGKVLQFCGYLKRPSSPILSRLTIFQFIFVSRVYVTCYVDALLIASTASTCSFIILERSSLLLVVNPPEHPPAHKGGKRSEGKKKKGSVSRRIDRSKMNRLKYYLS